MGISHSGGGDAAPVTGDACGTKQRRPHAAAIRRPPMNRRERRRAASQSRIRKFDIPSLTAVHEAGHAAARILTAPELGYSGAEAVDKIEIAAHAAVASATTYGPFCSYEMNPFFRLEKDVPVGPAQIKECISACRRAGIDIDRWLRLKCLILMSGAVAEAQSTGQELRKVVNQFECGSDLLQSKQLCGLAGLTEEEAWDVCEIALDDAQLLFSDSSTWQATLELARAIGLHPVSLTPA
jgi:hypothetical protein